MKYKKLIVLFLMTVLLVVIYLCIPQEVNNKIDDFTKLLLENMPQVMRSELNDLHAQRNRYYMV